MKKINHALIMAAGRGSRLRPFTDIVPKAMVPYMQTTLIGHGIQKLAKLVENIHVTVGYKGALLTGHVIEMGVSSVFNTNGKGNAWWLFNTPIKFLNEPILVLTCDNVTDLDLDWITKEYARLKEPADMLMAVNPKEGLEGDFIFHKGGIVSKISRTEAAPTYCSGIQVINPAKVNKLVKPTESFNEVWHHLIKKKSLCTTSAYPKSWFSVDSIEQLNRFAGDV